MEVQVGEIWKDIEGYEGYYQISNYGRVKSKERVSPCCYGKTRLLKEKIIAPSKDKNGYFRIMLCKDSNKKRYYIHELVAQAFISEYKKGKVIHHIDYDNQNNYYKNLFICSRNEHKTLHNNTNKLIKELIEKKIIQFESMSYKVGD